MINILNKISYFCLFFILINNLVSFSCSERSKVASVESNMHTLKAMIETYGVDWGGNYPNNFDQLKKEAIKNNYWKPLEDFWNNKSTLVLTTYVDEKSDFNFIKDRNYSEGTILYTPLIDRKLKSITNYKIYGVAKTNNPYFYISSYINNFLNIFLSTICGEYRNHLPIEQVHDLNKR